MIHLYIRLFFVCIWLWNWLSENLRKVLTSEWVTTVVSDEVVETVEHLLLNQVVHCLPIALLCTYPTVIHWSMR